MTKKIKNFQQLATNDLRIDLFRAIEAGLEAIDTERVFQNSIHLEGDILQIKEHKIDLSLVGKVVVVGAGKCSADAAWVLENVLGDRIDRGVVIGVGLPTQAKGVARNFKRIKYLAGDHPFPTENNIALTKELLEAIRGLDKDDLVIVVVSGGGSTLLCQPPAGIGAREEQELLDALFHAGASIQEINTLRKHLSYARGGYLAQAANPAQVIACILSDVPGDEIEHISSGPTIKDSTTIEDAQGILARYDTNGRFEFLMNKFIETPKDQAIFDRVTNILLLSNRLALEAMKADLSARGYNVNIVTTRLVGDAVALGRQIASEIAVAPEKTALLYGGETTVNITGTGKGGRNQTLALAALTEVKEGTIVTSVASDGCDNGDFAGAFADSELRNRAANLGLDIALALQNFDSTTFFTKLGYYIETGPTGSNVADLIVALKK
jgi:glycerate-2-kinase